MFWNKNQSLSYLGRILLLSLPVLYTWAGLWSGFYEMLLLLVVLAVGRKTRVLTTGILLGTGYSIALLVFRGNGFGTISFVPLAGLVVLQAWQLQLTTGAVVFWGMFTAGLLAVLPLLYLPHLIDAQTMQEIVDEVIKQYRDAGRMIAFQQQGIAENVLRDMIAESLMQVQRYTPGLVALGGISSMGVAYYLNERLPWKYAKKVPFLEWRFPWYAVWGAILGISIYLLGDVIHQEGWKIIGQNIMFAYAIPTMILGIAVYLYVIKALRLPAIWKGVLVGVFILFAPFTVISSIMFGLFDMVLNFRRLPNGSDNEPDIKE